MFGNVCKSADHVAWGSHWDLSTTRDTNIRHLLKIKNNLIF